MKQISIVAAIILLVLAAVFFMRDRGAREELQNAQKESAGLSNEVAKVNTLMTLHSSTNSELKDHIVRYLERMSSLSNRIARISDDLKHAQTQHQTTQGELGQASKKATDGESRVAELDNEVRLLRKMIEGRESEIARLNRTLQETQSERAVYHTRLQKAEAELASLQQAFNDTSALREQISRLKKQPPVVAPVGAPAAAPEASTDIKGGKAMVTKIDRQARGYYMQIQPDGTVKLVPPQENVGASTK